MFNLRTWYLWIKQIVRNAVAQCDICGRNGVSSLSLHPEGMCSTCEAAYQVALKEFGTSVMVEDFIKQSGKGEFRRRFAGIYTNPLAESKAEYEALQNQVCVIFEDEAEEIPCFDTYPCPAPKGHPAQNCSDYDKTKAMGIAGLYDSEGKYNY